MAKKILCVLAAALLATVLSTASARAALILYPTGVDNSFIPLSGGSLDPHYTLAPEGSEAHYPPAVVMSLSNYWGGWPKPDDARWIYTADAFDSGARGNYIYRTSFDLTGYDPSTAQITGKWTADQYGSIYLNSVYTGISVSDFTNLHAFAVSTGFIAGMNVLEFRVPLPDGGDGLVVSEIHANATAVPLPATLLLFGPGLAGLAALRIHLRKER